MSRKIRLMRKETVRYGLPRTIANEKVLNLGSFIDKNGNVFRPLSFEEENKYMPQIVNVQPNDPAFRQIVTNKYKELRVKIGSEGEELEIGIDEYGNPINVEHYLIYKLAINHPWFAKNKELLNANEHYQFYILDPEAEDEVKGKSIETLTQAYVEFAKIKEEETKLDTVLRNLIVKYPEVGAISEIVKYKIDKKARLIGNIIEKDPSYFLEIVSDSDISYKAEIASMVEAGVIIKEGKRYINGTESLGTLDSTIAWMKDPNNAESYAILQARLSEFGTPVKYEPKRKSK
jgi:hypothetical protein